MNKWLLPVLAAFLIAASAMFRFLYASPFAATWDQVDFALAVTDYDITVMQPHFPGYPLFILAGMLGHMFVDDPAQALSAANAVLAASAAVPMYMLARRFVPAGAAILLTALLQTSGYFAILVTQPMSEGAALSVFWWYLWSLEAALRTKERKFQLLAAFIFAVLMGVRLSYVPFGVGLLLIWCQEFKENRAYTLGLIGAAAVFQFVWVGMLIWNAGGIEGFWKLSLGFVEGHFTEWGGAVTETEEPLWSRLYRLLMMNIGFVGMFTESRVVMVLFVLLALAGWRGMRWNKQHAWLFLLFVAYLIWNWLGQNIDKPRHSYPLSMLVVFALGIAAARRPLGRPVLLAAAACQLAVSVPLMQEQASAPPATYQLAAYLAKQKDPFIVYTWEETRVLSYLQVPYEHKRFYKYDYFLQDKKYRTDDTIYVTNHLVEGFLAQGVQAPGQLKKEAVFRSRKLFDPIYHEIILYRWTQASQ